MIPLEILLSSIHSSIGIWIGLAADYSYRVGVPDKGGIRIPSFYILYNEEIPEPNQRAKRSRVQSCCIAR